MRSRARVGRAALEVLARRAFWRRAGRRLRPRKMRLYDNVRVFVNGVELQEVSAVEWSAK